MSANDELQAHTCEKVIEENARLLQGDCEVNVENNVAQGKVQDLTEKWKNGELEDGLYYCELACFDYKPAIARCKSGCIGLASFSKSEEVLAPVPSYDEWQELKEHCKVLKEALTNHEEIRNGLYNECDNLEKENQQLKTLLREWMHFYPIILYEHEDTLKTKDIVELFDKTREVLK